MPDEEKQIEIKKGYTLPEPPAKPEEEIIQEGYVFPPLPQKPNEEPPRKPPEKEN